MRLEFNHTPKSWQFGFGFDLPGVSQIPLNGYYSVGGLRSSLYFGPFSFDVVIIEEHYVSVVTYPDPITGIDTQYNVVAKSHL